MAGIHSGEQVLLLVTGDIRNLEAEDAFRDAWARLAASDSLLMLEEVAVSSKGLGGLRESLTDVRRNVLVVPGGKANRSFAGVLQTEIQLGDSLDFVLYAESYGAKGHRISEQGQLTPLLQQCHKDGGVHLIELPVDYTDNDRVLNNEIRERSAAL